MSDLRKLYIVGWKEADPTKWDSWIGGHCLVLAKDEDEAKELAGDLVDERLVTEVDMTKSAMLYYDGHRLASMGL